MKLIRLATMSAVLMTMTAPAVASAQDADDNARIMDEGLNRSQIQQTAHELVDGIGPRLTNSTNMRAAEDWAMAKMRALGLENVRKEGFEFGRGWEVVASSVRMISPRDLELTAIPVAWHPGTNGPLEAEIFVAPISREEHFDAYRGLLSGKIVLLSVPGTGDEPGTAPFRRLTPAEISERDAIELPQHDDDALEDRLKRRDFAKKLDAFLVSEGAAAWAKMSYRDGKLVHGTGYSHRVGETPSLPAVEIAAEDYRRLTRLAKSGASPRVRIDTSVRYLDDDTQSYNIIGDLPGTDKVAGYVMAGAHIDSWHGADGAVDNAAGVVTILEAARILKNMGVKPRRTVRFAFWGAEEQGLHGSLAYARQHLVSRDGEASLAENDVSTNWRYLYPIRPKPGFSDLKAYFNMDNGSGKFRGIHAEGNVGAEPLLKKWMAPFGDLGATSVVSGNTGGTDHVYFQALGLPAFQFIQDPLDYFARLHHTNADTFDHLRPDDLRQAAVVMAGMLLSAANDTEVMPRKPLPSRPTDTDPFGYDFPDVD